MSGQFLSKKKLGIFVLCFLVFCLGFYFGLRVQKQSTLSHQIQLPPAFDRHLKLTAGEFLQFCQQDPTQAYQDIVIKGKTVFQGVNRCANRYALIKPILDNLGEKDFSVLDVGAGQGYFSFRIAYGFTQSHCFMVEHANKNYDHHGRMLYQLCLLNDLPNVTFFHQEISVPVLEQLNRQTHFDVVLALLVVHQIDESMDVRKAALENLLSLGNHIILEMSNDVAPELRDYVRDELKSHPDYECSFLGEVQRYYNPATACGGKYPDGKGEFYYFKKKTPIIASTKIAPKVFAEMTGVYP